MPEFSHEYRLNTPSYSELVRALAFALGLLEVRAQLLPVQEAQLEAARKLLLRAQAPQ